MIENGYVKFAKQDVSFDDNGRPILGETEWGDLMPACIEGNLDTSLYNGESGTRYTKASYSVYVRKCETSDRVQLFDRKKVSLGIFSIRTMQYSPIVNEIKFTV